jgi:molybdopterin molybdotransferase
MSGLIPWEEARELVLAGVVPLPPVEVALEDALGLAAAQTVLAPECMPPFDNSAVDGFAVRAADVGGVVPTDPRRLQVVGERPAGATSPLRVDSGQACRIMTGAPLPEGADAVVMIENTDAWDALARAEPGSRDAPPRAEFGGRDAPPRAEPGSRAEPGGSQVEIRRHARPGENVRRKGESVAAGAILLEPGQVVRPAELGLLISVGVRSILAHPLPRVAVLSTGDELVPPGTDPGPGQIRDSNRPALLAALRRRGFPTLDLGLVPDDEEALAEAVLRGAREADFLLTSGGVSVGDRDLTHRVLSRLGRVNSMKVAMKPGKPQLFGTLEGTPVYGLPGNPVSSLVVFDEFVLPALKKRAGRRDLLRPLFRARLGAPIRRKPGRTEFVRVRLAVEDGVWVARDTGPQGSGVLSSMTRANGYAILPADAGDMDAGAAVLCRLWED